MAPTAHPLWYLFGVMWATFWEILATENLMTGLANVSHSGWTGTLYATSSAALVVGYLVTGIWLVRQFLESRRRR